jgi:hypothetical protein
VNKTDLLPYLDFDVGIAIDFERSQGQSGDQGAAGLGAHRRGSWKTGSTGSAPRGMALAGHPLGTAAE